MKQLLAAAALLASTSACLAADTFTVTVPAPAVPASQNFTPAMIDADQLSGGFLVDTPGFVSARFQVNGYSCFEVVQGQVDCGYGPQRVTVQASTDGINWEPLGGAGVWKNLPLSDRLNSPISATGKLALPDSQKKTNLRLRIAFDDTRPGTGFGPIVGAATVQFYR